MQWSRLSRAAGVVAVAVTGAVVVGAPPASADITVDSAVCLNNATATLTSPRPTILPTEADQVLDYPIVTWHATTQTTYCTSANARLLFVLDGEEIPGSYAANGSAELLVPGQWKLRLRTSLGQKDLAQLRITFG